MSDIAKQLAQQVIETQQGITPEQLKALLEGANPQPIQQEPVVTPPAPIPQPQLVPAPQPAPMPVPAPAPAFQPNVLDIIPEQFRSVDLPTSLQNITKSYSDLQADLRKQKDETENLKKIVQSIVAQGPIPAPMAPIVQGAEEELDDTKFFEKPSLSAREIARKEVTAQILAYHQMQEEKTFVDNFKAQHRDFDLYREDIFAILKMRPDLDRAQHLPVVFEMARSRYASRLEAMKVQLGLTPQPVQPALAPASMDIEAIRKAEYEKAKNDLIQELNQRRAALGIQGAGSTTSPDVRVQPKITQVPLTPEDALIQAMLDSGPKKLSLDV